MEALSAHQTLAAALIGLFGTAAAVTVAFAVMRHTAEASRYKTYLECFKIAKELGIAEPQDEVWARRTLRLVAERANARVAWYYALQAAGWAILACVFGVQFWTGSGATRWVYALGFSVAFAGAADGLQLCVHQSVGGPNPRYAPPKSIWSSTSLLALSCCVVVVLWDWRASSSAVWAVACWVGIVITALFSVGFAAILYGNLRIAARDLKDTADASS